MGDVRIFLSFDVDHDGDLCERLSEQSQRGGAGFLVAARSQPGEPTDRWCNLVRDRIRDADGLIVMCGEHTEESHRMSRELAIAVEEEKPYFLLWGRRERMCTMPAQVPRNGCMYSWTWEILLHQISDALRKEPVSVVASQFKRR